MAGGDWLGLGTLRGRAKVHNPRGIELVECVAAERTPDPRGVWIEGRRSGGRSGLRIPDCGEVVWVGRRPLV